MPEIVAVSNGTQPRGGEQGVAHVIVDGAVAWHRRGLVPS